MYLLSLGSFILDLCRGRREHKIVKLVNVSWAAQ